MNIVLLRRCMGWGLALTLGSLSLPAASGQRVALSMVAPALPAAAVDLGPVQSETPVQVVLYLQPPAERKAALRQYLKALQTPADATYRRWSTPQQFAQRFGATSDQVDRVTKWAKGNGLSVTGPSLSGLNVSVSGTAVQIEAALAPSLHSVQIAEKAYLANRAAPSIEASIASDVLAIGGIDTVPSAHPMLVASSSNVTPDDSLAAVSASVNANNARVLSISSTACTEDVDAASQAAMELVLEQASAQGITILATDGCGSRGSAGFPAISQEVVAVAASPGLTPSSNPLLTVERPDWQVAPGLPSDAFRHEPDLTSDIDAFSATMTKILASFPASEDGLPARLGNINAILYELAPMKGLYTQPDGAAAGTWEASTGLGQVDLKKLEQFFPRGVLATYVSIDAPPYYATHGSTFTFTSTVKDTSGQGNGAVASGTVTFKIGSALALGPVALVNGTAQTTSNQLPGGTYAVTASYSGDTNYAAASSTPESITVAPEAAVLSGAALATPAVGGSLVLSVSAKSTSGVGTPSNAIVVHPTTADYNSTYTGKLSGSGGTATALVTVPAVQAGADQFVLSCDDSDPSFTCTQQSISANVNKATPAISFTYSPNPPVQGQTIQFTAKVLGAGGKVAVPSGNVNFSNNGVDVAPATLQADGTATSNPTANFNYSASGNTFVATYGGDNNYNASSSTTTTTGTAIVTSTFVSVSPNSVPVGSNVTLVATVTPAQTSSASISGTVNFTSGTTKLCSATVSAGAASCAATFSAVGTPSTIGATYSGDTNFASSPSTNTPLINVTKGSTSVSVVATPATTVANQTTTFTASVSATNAGAVPVTGSVVFYVNGTAQTPSTVSNGQAAYSTTLATGSTSVYAVYSGDGNWNGSQSSALTYTIGSTSTGSGTGTAASVIAVTSSTSSAVPGSNILLTATLSKAPGSTATSAFSGSITFYDSYNGVNTALGTATVVSSSAASGVAQWNTAGLKQGTHLITAVYSGDSNYAAQTSAAYTISLSDYSITFSPASLTLAAGASGTAIATITPLTNFSGTVALTCLVPTGSSITCSFNPASVSTSGTSTLTVVTQASSRAAASYGLRRKAESVALAMLVFGLFVPKRRKRAVLFMAVLACGLLGAVGCTTLNNAGNGSSTIGGTSTGTYALTISSAGTDKGGFTVTHSMSYQVTVQ